MSVSPDLRVNSEFKESKICIESKYCILFSFFVYFFVIFVCCFLEGKILKYIKFVLWLLLFGLCKGYPTMPNHRLEAFLFKTWFTVGRPK